MLDFRVGSRKETRNLSIKAKRDLYTYTLPNLIGKATLKGSLVKEAVMINSDDKSDQDKQVQDLPYVFTPNKMPVQKQLFYQLCDLHDPEIQRLISLNDGQVSGTYMNLSTSETLVSNKLIGSIRQNHRPPSGANEIWLVRKHRKRGWRGRSICLYMYMILPLLQGPVSQTSRNFSGPFLSHQISQSSWFFYIKNIFKRSAFQNKRIAVWQLAFWTRKVLGTFKKQAPALTTGSLIIAFGTFHSTIHDDHLCILKLCLYVYKNTKMYVLIVSLRSSKWSSSYELAWPVDCENNGCLYLT